MLAVKKKTPAILLDICGMTFIYEEICITSKRKCMYAHVSDKQVYFVIPTCNAIRTP